MGIVWDSSEQCSEMSLSESRTWSPFIEQSMEWFTLELVSLVQGSSSNSSSSSPDEPSAAEHKGKLWQSRARCLNAVALETIAPWQKLQPQWTWSCSHSSQLQRKISYFSSHNCAILCHTWKQGTGYQYIKTSFVYSEHAHLIWRHYLLKINGWCCRWRCWNKNMFKF